MAELVLTVNAGSTSFKYSFYQGDAMLLDLHYERGADNEAQRTTTLQNRHTQNDIIADSVFEQSLKDCITIAKNHELDTGRLRAIGVRIVAPGTFFARHTTIDSEYIDTLKKAADMAPLHIRTTLDLIKKIKETFPDTDLYAISDSALHAEMPAVAKSYAINQNDARRYDIYRFGYHGISIGSALHTLRSISGNSLPAKVIVCHLGGGSSITAVKDGKSVDTSMGFSPLEGLPMATRSGSIDTGAAIYLASRQYLTDEQLLEYLNTQCGLLGLSNSTADVRTLIDRAHEGNQDADFALEFFAYKVRHYIGAYMAQMGGLDVLTFTGTIGYRSDVMRRMICAGLEDLHIRIDPALNESVTDSMYINQTGETGIAVVRTDEQSEIARILNGML